LGNRPGTAPSHSGSRSSSTGKGAWAARTPAWPWGAFFCYPVTFFFAAPGARRGSIRVGLLVLIFFGPLGGRGDSFRVRLDFCATPTTRGTLERDSLRGRWNRGRPEGEPWAHWPRHRTGGLGRRFLEVVPAFSLFGTACPQGAKPRPQSSGHWTSPPLGSGGGGSWGGHGFDRVAKRGGPRPISGGGAGPGSDRSVARPSACFSFEPSSQWGVPS